MLAATTCSSRTFGTASAACAGKRLRPSGGLRPTHGAQILGSPGRTRSATQSPGPHGPAPPRCEPRTRRGPDSVRTVIAPRSMRETRPASASGSAAVGERGIPSVVPTELRQPRAGLYRANQRLMAVRRQSVCMAWPFPRHRLAGGHHRTLLQITVYHTGGFGPNEHSPREADGGLGPATADGQCTVQIRSSSDPSNRGRTSRASASATSASRPGASPPAAAAARIGRSNRASLDEFRNSCGVRQHEPYGPLQRRSVGKRLVPAEAGLRPGPPTAGGRPT